MNRFLSDLKEMLFGRLPTQEELDILEKFRIAQSIGVKVHVTENGSVSRTPWDPEKVKKLNFLSDSKLR